MSTEFQKYRKLQNQLTWIRWSHLGHESDEEDELLEIMDEAWWQLSDEERLKISNEPSRTDLISPDVTQTEYLDVDLSNHSGPVRRKVA